MHEQVHHWRGWTSWPRNARRSEESKLYYCSHRSVDETVYEENPEVREWGEEIFINKDLSFHPNPLNGTEFKVFGRLNWLWGHSRSSSQEKSSRSAVCIRPPSSVCLDEEPLTRISSRSLAASDNPQNSAKSHTTGYNSKQQNKSLLHL